MRIRKDGVETREKILNAAGLIFAKKGYREATIAQICKQAGTNVASVNYHFRDKENLYVEVWRYLGQKSQRLYPIKNQELENKPVADRLYDHVVTTIRKMLDKTELGSLFRLFLLEFANPTGLIEEVIKENTRPLREKVDSIIRDALGPQATQRHIALCDMSLRGLIHSVKHGPNERSPFDVKPYSEEEILELADHVTRFSLAGLQSIRDQIERELRQETKCENAEKAGVKLDS